MDIIRWRVANKRDPFLDEGDVYFYLTPGEIHIHHYYNLNKQRVEKFENNIDIVCATKPLFDKINFSSCKIEE